MISILREEGTDYLFAGMLAKEMVKHPCEHTITLAIEPKKGDFYFCQDYSFGKELQPKFVFYALPSWRNDHVKLMGENTALVSYAADPEFHRSRGVEKKYDVGFIGRRYYPERNKLLEAVQNAFPRSFLNLDTCPHHEVPERLDECRVLLNHTRESIDVNLRFFEEMAMGCQVMLRTPALPEFATEGVHYLGYSTEDEAIETIQMLLRDEDRRTRIATDARSHFLANHTYAHRATAIINHINAYFERSGV